MQNRSHIKHLKAFLGEQVPMRSIIVFSDRCTLKSVQIHSANISVINRYRVAPIVSSICNQITNDLLTDNDITEIYNKLYPYTQVNEITKLRHKANIHSSFNSQSIPDVNETPNQPVSQTQAETIMEQPDAVFIDTITATEEKTIIGNVEPITEEKTKQQALNCPKCNGNLVLRTATRGTNAGKQFYGCSNYPKCNYIQNVIEGER
ncbi:MAG: topoisomerase DNA-binding C4 zinc finger domain-containing protein [Clostridia bacterium]|nr:topoisomerase DNA-binding C4 zinc finger domain-containing protein [Clostridia bacterium]